MYSLLKTIHICIFNLAKLRDNMKTHSTAFVRKAEFSIRIFFHNLNFEEYPAKVMFAFAVIYFLHEMSEYIAHLNATLQLRWRLVFTAIIYQHFIMNIFSEHV